MTRAQLIGLGFSAKGIDHRLRTGWLYRVCLGHRSAAARRRDAIRDNEHVASGMTRLRFTHWQVKYEPGYVRAILARTVAVLG